MISEFIYRIDRDGVDSEIGAENLIGRTELVAHEGVLAVRYPDGTERNVTGSDVRTIVASDPALHVINTDSTSIYGRREVLDHLPLLLQVGDDRHYVEIDGWECAVLETTDGWRVVEEGYRIDNDLVLPVEWAAVSFIEEASRTSGTTSGRLGLITPAVVADFYYDDDGGGRILTLSPRGDDAATLRNWLVSGPFTESFYGSEDHDGRALLTHATFRGEGAVAGCRAVEID